MGDVPDTASDGRPPTGTSLGAQVVPALSNAAACGLPSWERPPSRDLRLNLG